MKTKTYDFRTFVSTGELVTKGKGVHVRAYERMKLALTTAGVFAVLPSAASAATQATGPDMEKAFDPVIHMLQNMSLPVASIVLAWACLQAMIGHPAQAVDKAKWAVLGFLAMKYVPGLLESLG